MLAGAPCLVCSCPAYREERSDPEERTRTA